MLIVLRGQLDVVKRVSDLKDGSSMVNVEAKGSVVSGHKGPDSKQAKAFVQFHVKPLVLDDVQLGAPVYIVITDDAEAIAAIGGSGT